MHEVYLVHAFIASTPELKQLPRCMFQIRWNVDDW